MVINKKTIYFSENNLFSKISEILEKYGIKENLSDAAFSDESLIIAVAKLTRSFIEEKISEKIFIDNIAQQLSVDLKISQNIEKDIKDKILPFAETAETVIKNEKSTQALSQEKENDIFPKIEPLTNIEKISTDTTAAPKRIKKTPTVIKAPVEQIKKSSGPDAYREPIE